MFPVNKIEIYQNILERGDFTGFEFQWDANSKVPEKLLLCKVTEKVHEGVYGGRSGNIWGYTVDGDAHLITEGALYRHIFIQLWATRLEQRKEMNALQNTIDDAYIALMRIQPALPILTPHVSEEAILAAATPLPEDTEVIEPIDALEMMYERWERWG